MGLELLDEARAVVPGGWVTGDDDFGRCGDLRGQLRRRLRYVPDVPCNTPARDVSERRPASRPRTAAAIRKEEGGRVGPSERRVVIRTCESL